MKREKGEGGGKEVRHEKLILRPELSQNGLRDGRQVTGESRLEVEGVWSALEGTGARAPTAGRGCT